MAPIISQRTIISVKSSSRSNTYLYPLSNLRSPNSQITRPTTQRHPSTHHPIPNSEPSNTKTSTLILFFYGSNPPLYPSSLLIGRLDKKAYNIKQQYARHRFSTYSLYITLASRPQNETSISRLIAMIGWTKKAKSRPCEKPSKSGLLF